MIYAKLRIRVIEPLCSNYDQMLLIVAMYMIKTIFMMFLMIMMS